MLRTRCNECESACERQEDFHDISVPVRLENSDCDDDDDDESMDIGLLRYIIHLLPKEIIYTVKIV